MQEAEGLQSVLVLLSADPSLRRSRADLPAAGGLCALIKGGRLVIASVAAGSHSLALGKTAPCLPECRWFHLAVTVDVFCSGVPSGMGKVRTSVYFRLSDVCSYPHCPNSSFWIHCYSVFAHCECHGQSLPKGAS